MGRLLGKNSLVHFVLLSDSGLQFNSYCSDKAHGLIIFLRDSGLGGARGWPRRLFLELGPLQIRFGSTYNRLIALSLREASTETIVASRMGLKVIIVGGGIAGLAAVRVPKTSSNS